MDVRRILTRGDKKKRQSLATLLPLLLQLTLCLFSNHPGGEAVKE